ncbi:MAG: helix-turn-helix transcriptional regulator [Cyanobacteria bacterium P01_F01_bin.86]
MIKITNCLSYKSLVSWLKKERESRALTLREAGLLMQEPHSFVDKTESGERKLGVHEFVQYCQALGIDPHVGVDMLMELQAKDKVVKQRKQ